MVSTFTPNIQLEEPARGDQVGVWDTPVNNNMTLIDSIVGGQTTIALNNSPVTLSAAQFQCRMITFTGALTGHCFITFPSSFKKSYEIQNLCTNSSVYVVVLALPGLAPPYTCPPPGEITEHVNDGVGFKHKNLARVGSYMDVASTFIPPWATLGVPAAYLNCDGSTFSSSTFPALAAFLGGTTLPDSRGKFRATLNQGQGLITAGVSGLDGNTLRATGGNQFLHAHWHTASISDPGHAHGGTYKVDPAATGSGPDGPFGAGYPNTTIPAALTGVRVNSANGLDTVNTTGSGASQNIPPAYMGGLTLIRAG